MNTNPNTKLSPKLSGRAPGDGPDLLGRFADFTIGTAVVMWHAVLASREQRRRIDRSWSSTR